MVENVSGVTGTTEIRIPSEKLSEVFSLNERGHLTIQDEALGRLINEQAKLPATMARASTEVTVSVSVRF